MNHNMDSATFNASPCAECNYRPTGKRMCKYFQVCERYEAWEDKDEGFMSFSIPTTDQKAKIEAEEAEALEKLKTIAAKNPGKATITLNKVPEPENKKPKAKAKSTKKGCKVPNCPNPHHSRGFCSTHYTMWRKGELRGFGPYTVKNPRISDAMGRNKRKKEAAQTGRVDIISLLEERRDEYLANSTAVQRVIDLLKGEG